MVEDIASALSWENAIELGEAPDVLAANSEFLAKIAAPQGKIVDGHGQGLDMKHLNAYIDCSIVSDHKSTSLEPAKEKLKYHRITGSEA
jgi:adenine deaminase